MNEVGAVGDIAAEIARKMGVLLRSTSEADAAFVARLFKNPAIKEQFLKGTRSIDDLAEVVERKYLHLGEVTNVKIYRDATDINAELAAKHKGTNKFQNPYKPSTEPIERITTQQEQYVRFYTQGQSGQVSKWMVRKSEVEGLTPAQIKDKLSLEFEPTHVIDVHVSPGVKVREGVVAEIADYGTSGGKIQIELLEEIPESSFKSETSRPLGDIFT